VPGTQRRDELRERQARGTAERVGRDVRRRERTELPAARQELSGVDLFGLADEGIAAGRVRRVRVAVVARTRIDQVTAQADERAILSFEIERNRVELVAALDLALAQVVRLNGSDGGDRESDTHCETARQRDRSNTSLHHVLLVAKYGMATAA